MKRPGWPTIGPALKSRMENLDMSQAELARRAKLSEPTLRGLLTGKPRGAAPRATTLRRLSRALNYTDNSIEQMLNGRGPTPIATTEAPVETGAMLTEILSEIRTHRASDIAPSGHLMDMPTRDEFKAALAAAAVARGEEIDRLTRMVEEVDRKVEELRSGSSAPRPPAAPGARKRSGTPRSRSTRNVDR